MAQFPKQDGVVARRHLVERGWSDADIRRALRRRELATVHRGVYVDHTGPLTWQQRAWAAVLYAWPAALCDVSALEAHRRDVGSTPIHVAVEMTRTVVAPPGVVVHRRAEVSGRVAWHFGPPRVVFDEAVVDVAARQHRRLDAVGVLAEAVSGWHTTPDRLVSVLRSRPRVRDRAWLERVLVDIESGTWSALEHGYLNLVERPHALPVGRRQVRHVGTGGPVYRDVELPGSLIVELDGRAHHSSTLQRDRDFDRDLAAAADHTTVRLGYGQVFDRACSTAHGLGSVLRRLGWDGAVARCSSQCGPESRPS